MTITPNPSVTALPAAPQRLTDTPAAFVSKADALMAALPTFSTQISAVGAAAQANGEAAEAAATSAEASAAAAVGGSSYMGTTAGTLNVATGSQSFTLAQTGKAFAVGMQVSLILLSDDSVRLTGALTAFNAGTGAATINVAKTMGAVASGAGWAVILKAFEGLSPDQVNARAIAFSAAL
jgi:hypothetical protein